MTPNPGLFVVKDNSRIASTFAHCGRELAACANKQMRYGLRYMLGNGASKLVFALMSGNVPMALRFCAIGALDKLDCDAGREEGSVSIAARQMLGRCSVAGSAQRRRRHAR